MNIIRKEEKAKTKDNMVRQRHPVDRYGLRKSTLSNGQQKSMKKDDPWCGQLNPRKLLGVRFADNVSFAIHIDIHNNQPIFIYPQTEILATRLSYRLT